MIFLVALKTYVKQLKSCYEKDDIGAILFIASVLIKSYQEDILLGVTATGVFMIAIGIIMILTSKIK